MKAARIAVARSTRVSHIRSLSSAANVASNVAASSVASSRSRLTSDVDSKKLSQASKCEATIVKPAKEKHIISIEYLQQKCTVTSCTMGESQLEINWADGHVSRFHYIWLRDHCPQSFDAVTKQRTIETSSIPLDIVPNSATIEDIESASLNHGRQLVVIDWGRDSKGASAHTQHTSSFDAGWLRASCYSREERARRDSIRSASRTSWDRTLSVEFQQYADVMQSDKALWYALRQIWRYGILNVEGIDPNKAAEQTEAFVHRIGKVRETLYGGMWVFGAGEEETVDEAMADSAYSSVGLGLHTDCTYMQDSPGLQMWTCVHQARSGGTSRYVDGLKVAEVLRRREPEAFHFLSTTPLPFHCQDTDVVTGHRYSLHAMAPVLELGHDQELLRFRHNDYDRSTLAHLSEEQVLVFYRAQKALHGIVTDPAMELTLDLAPGQMTCLMNHRVMHGRTAFEGKRVLAGCYMNADDLYSTLRLLDHKMNGLETIGASASLAVSEATGGRGGSAFPPCLV